MLISWMWDTLKESTPLFSWGDPAGDGANHRVAEKPLNSERSSWVKMVLEILPPHPHPHFLLAAGELGWAKGWGWSFAHGPDTQS